MRILHVIPSLSPLRGGPSFALPMMARGLAQLGAEVAVVTTDDDGPSGHLEVPLGVPVNQDGVTYRYFRRQTSFYSASWPLTRWLGRNVGQYDLVHIHALFSYAALPASLAARAYHVPYVVRPLGTLSRWSVEQRRPVLKRWSFRLVESRIVRHAAAMHYTSAQEQHEAAAFGISMRPIVTPLPVDTDLFDRLPSRMTFGHHMPALANRPYVLYLSRLDRKKGLDLLIPAFAAVAARYPDVMLVIAGEGDQALQTELDETVLRLGLNDRVVFAGHLDGDRKLAAFAGAITFVLPSYSENFGIAPVEALAAGVPVVLTDRVGVAEQVRESGAGLVVSPSVDAIADAMCYLLGDPDLRSRISANATQLAREHYSVHAVSTRLRDAYQSIVR